MSEARPITDFLKPKRFGRSKFAENEDSELIVKDTYEGLERYNCCYCGHFCAILDATLATLPKRSTDGSTAVARKHVLKQRLEEGEKKRIKRPKGIETQYRMLCPGCKLFVAYRSTPDARTAKYLYICEDALTQKATVLHVEGTNELAADVTKKAMVPKSVQQGTREKDSVRLVIRATPGCARSLLRSVTDDGVFVDLHTPPGAGEAEVNAELRRYIAMVLEKTSDEVVIDLGGFGDDTDTLAVIVRNRAHRLPVGKALLAACKKSDDDAVESAAGDKARAAIAAAMADSEAAADAAAGGAVGGRTGGNGGDSLGGGAAVAGGGGGGGGGGGSGGGSGAAADADGAPKKKARMGGPE